MADPLDGRNAVPGNKVENICGAPFEITRLQRGKIYVVRTIKETKDGKILCIEGVHPFGPAIGLIVEGHPAQCFRIIPNKDDERSTDQNVHPFIKFDLNSKPIREKTEA